MDKALRQKRKMRSRSKVGGTAQRPRASVFRGIRHISVQLIDDTTHTTLIAASSQHLKKKQAKTDKAREVGKAVAQAAKEKGISSIVFDRSGYKYHGRVKALAQAMRDEGLMF
jgi:large subunit ribosomal protein L18